MLVAKENGRDILELNASDTRSKKALSLELGDVTGSQVISFGGIRVGRKGSKVSVVKRCLVMDEVDGMGGGDRGGIAELISLIKKSRVPIICICNDRQSQKIKSLLPYCLDLRFKRPVKSVIARRALRIGEMEGMKIELNAVEAIAESCGNDIRQVLNCLQMWSSSKTGGKSLTYKGLKERESHINKDEILRVNMFDATKQIIEGRKGLTTSDPKAVKDSLYKRSDAFFVDYSLIGLNVHQNYLKVMVGGYQDAVRSKDDTKLDQFVERMHNATLAMSDFAVGEQAVRGGDMNWSLLPFISMMAVKTGYHAGGEHGGFLGGYPEFAGWMGKNSTRGKKLRLLHELAYHMNYKISTDESDLRLFYIPILRERLMYLLGNGEKANITEAIALMDEYGLDRDDVFEHMDEFRIDSKSKGFSDIDSKQKAAFTREYNQGAHKSQALVHEQGAGSSNKISRRGNNSTMESQIRIDQDVVDDDLVGDDEVDEEVEDEEELTEEKLKQLFGKKSKRMSEGSTSKTSTARKRKSK
jgi:replication factor C subunit 1